MNKINFWLSLEQYLWKLVDRSPLPHYWRHIGLGLVLIVLLTSLNYARYSAALAVTPKDIVVRAAQIGDYEIARRLYESCAVPQCQSVTEELVYPERKVERKIADLEQKLEEYPGNREIFLMLGEMYGQLGDEEMAEEYHEKARVLDPNNVEF